MDDFDTAVFDLEVAVLNLEVAIKSSMAIIREVL